jgi:hypothetical protein
LPELAPALGILWAPIWLLSVAGAGLFWMFAIELFEDRPRFDLKRLAPAAALVAIALGRFVVLPDIQKLLWLLHNLIGAALMTHVLVVVFTGWKNDLVEPRRRLRGPALAMGALYALGVTLVQASEIFWWSAHAFSPVAAGLLFAMSMASIAAFLRAICVRCRFSMSRTRCSIIRLCCSGLFTATKRIVGRVTASQIASASAASFFPRLT